MVYADIGDVTILRTPAGTPSQMTQTFTCTSDWNLLSTHHAPPRHAHPRLSSPSRQARSQSHHRQSGEPVILLVSLKPRFTPATTYAQRAVRQWVPAHLDNNGDHGCLHASHWLGDKFLRTLISTELTDRYNQWLDEVFDRDHHRAQPASPTAIATASKSGETHHPFGAAKRHFALAPLARGLTRAEKSAEICEEAR